jgi:hypothetical protein
MHHGTSCLDLVTLRAGLESLPDLFLQGAGIEREEVEALRAATSGVH